MVNLTVYQCFNQTCRLVKQSSHFLQKERAVYLEIFQRVLHLIHIDLILQNPIDIVMQAVGNIIIVYRQAKYVRRSDK